MHSGFTLSWFGVVGWFALGVGFCCFAVCCVGFRLFCGFEVLDLLMVLDTWLRVGVVSFMFMRLNCLLFVFAFYVYLCFWLLVFVLHCFWYFDYKLSLFRCDNRVVLGCIIVSCDFWVCGLVCRCLLCCLSWVLEVVCVFCFLFGFGLRRFLAVCLGFKVG